MPPPTWGNRVDQLMRLTPLLDLTILLALLTIIVQFYWRGGTINWGNISLWSAELRYAGIAGVILFVCLVFVDWTRIGIEPDRSGWYAPGTPILATQVMLALFVAIVGLRMGLRAVGGKLLSDRNPAKTGSLDMWLCAALWLSACLVWWLEPMRSASYFAPTPVPPNFEYYPYSDGAEYDGYAQDIVIGKGNEMGLIRRPLYAFFLAGLHLTIGQDYDWIIAVQIAVLALIPVLMFLLTSQFSNRTAGLMAALLVILRERNSIALTNVIEVSHSKLLLSELPALGLMLLLCLLLVRWLSDPKHNWALALPAGGVLGMLALIRSQSLLLAPVALVYAAWMLRPYWRQIFTGVLLFGLGLVVTILPWIVRNYQVSGRYVIEDTNKYIDLFASGYTFTPYESIAALPGESVNEHYDRMMDQIKAFIKEHPDEVARFYSAHFFHNEVSTFLYLPLSIHFYSLRSYVNLMQFWREPFSSLSIGSYASLAVNLALIALGIGSAFRKSRALIFVPILLYLGYSLSVIPARLSSGRFILPIDWTSLFFFSIGLVQLISILVSSVNPHLTLLNKENHNDVERSGEDARGRRILVMNSLFFLLLGLSIAISPELIPTRYPAVPPAQIFDNTLQDGIYLETGQRVPAGEIQSFLEQENNSVLTYGRDLYPRFYEAGEYWGDENPFNLAARKESRLQFDLIGPEPSSVILPRLESPKAFPQAADVVILGCSHSYGIRAIAIVVDKGQQAITAQPWKGLSCSTDASN